VGQLPVATEAHVVRWPPAARRARRHAGVLKT
jgi:hypothetical protein